MSFGRSICRHHFKIGWNSCLEPRQDIILQIVVDLFHRVTDEQFEKIETKFGRSPLEIDQSVSDCREGDPICRVHREMHDAPVEETHSANSVARSCHQFLKIRCRISAFWTVAKLRRPAGPKETSREQSCQVKVHMALPLLCEQLHGPILPVGFRNHCRSGPLPTTTNPTSTYGPTFKGQLRPEQSGTVWGNRYGSAPHRASTKDIRQWLHGRQ